ncbi:MAG TPA: hypothetical protein VMT53_10800 [Terriglobales bacterium]|nr:hypothetical protein [Terriglobales bacterium]
MPTDWHELLKVFLTTVGGGGVVLGVAAWLVREIVSSSIAREAEKFKIEIKAKADTEIEKVRAFLARGSRVHEQQLEVLQGMYVSLWEANRCFMRMQAQGHSANEVRPEAEEAIAAAHKKLVSGRLFVPEALAQQCDSFFQAICEGQAYFWNARETTNRNQRTEFEIKAATISCQEIPKILGEIEEAARGIIHGENDGNASFGTTSRAVLRSSPGERQ